jgi:hypothetical protein
MVETEVAVLLVDDGEGGIGVVEGLGVGDGVGVGVVVSSTLVG